MMTIRNSVWTNTFAGLSKTGGILSAQLLQTNILFREAATVFKICLALKILIRLRSYLRCFVRFVT